MLLPCLEREPQRWLALGISRDADQPAGHVPLERIARGEERRMRPAVSHRHTEPLRTADRHVRAELAGRLQERNGQEVGCHHHQCFLLMDLANERLIIQNYSVCRGILEQHPERLFVQREFSVVTDNDGNSQRFGARLDHRDGLRMTSLGNEKGVLAFASLQSVAHGHRFGSGRRFIQKRRVGDFQTRQVGHHGLKIQQRFESSLGNLRLIRCVLRIPAGVLQNVPLDDGRGDAIVISHADERAPPLVLRDDLLQLGEYLILAARWRE